MRWKVNGDNIAILILAHVEGGCQTLVCPVYFITDVSKQAQAYNKVVNLSHLTSCLCVYSA